MQKGVPLHKTEWLLCHVCKNKTRIKLRQDTVLDHFPLYCPKFNGRADQFFLVFSVIETAKANGLDAKKYLTYLFDIVNNTLHFFLVHFGSYAAIC